MSDLIVFDDEKVRIVKEMMCKNATQAEFELFIHMAQRLQLDPVLKQIYFIKFGAQMSIIVSIDGYRCVAERTGKYMPGREPVFSYDKDGKLFSATSFVKKYGPDKQWHEIGATAIRAEYDTGKNQWAKGPHYMLAKCAESLALRKAFPSEMAGTNTDEEMEKPIIDVAAVNRNTGEIEHKPSDPVMTIAQGIKLATLIGDDMDYKNKIFRAYNVKDFIEIPAKNYELILSRIETHNKERLEKEMADVEVPNA